MALKDTTLRDFGGGWNVADSDLNLASKYQPISVNTMRGVDGSVYTRWGTKLVANFEDGTTSELHNAGISFGTTNTDATITVAKVGHGMSSGDHITISGVVTTVNGIPPADFNRTHGIVSIDADNFKFTVRSAANATSTVALAETVNIIRDTHTLSGNIIHKRYFNRRLVVFTDIGEIGTWQLDGTHSRIWDYEKALALTGNPLPCRECDMWSSGTFKATLIACNGYTKDKPIQVFNDFSVEYLADKAASSNSGTPKADFVLCTQSYVIFARTDRNGRLSTGKDIGAVGDTYIEISAKNTDGVFIDSTPPDDAVEVDLSRLTETVDPIILGLAAFRDKVFVTFYDKAMIGTVGTYTGSVHEPDFTDTISEHGSISNDTLVPLGNDIFMADYAGVPSVTISQQSGIFVPFRVSELIAPYMRAHLTGLSETLLKEKAFAIYNRSERSYMLFVPKCDQVEWTTETNPLRFNEDLQTLNQAVMFSRNHKLFDRSYVTIAGATAVDGLLASQINGTREIVAVIDKDHFVIQLAGNPQKSSTVFGGGSSLTYTPINDETLVYVFEYNRELKLRRWTLFRGWDFECATVSQRGRVYLSKGLRVYQMGNEEDPVEADYVGNYTVASWNTSTAYTAGDKVFDSDDGITYSCLSDHTSASSGTFEQDRAAKIDTWEEYLGEDIIWEVETPWSDMNMRGNWKKMKAISVDAEGRGAFTMSLFVNQIRENLRTGALIPARSLTFQAGDSGGWGSQTNGPFGGGRRSRDERTWPCAATSKLFRWRISGNSKTRIRFISVTMYYQEGTT